jgi:competence protein ComEA
MSGVLLRIAFAALLLAAGPVLAKAPAAGATSAVASDDALVDLNSASVEVLCTLPGIGPKKAEAIVTFRARRPFVRVTQLLLVKGIGKRTLDRLKPRLVVLPVQTAQARVPSVPGT